MKTRALITFLLLGSVASAAPQTYDFTVRVTDEDGDYDEKAFSLTVLDAPDPDGFSVWAEQISDANQRGETDDFDNDGLPNLLEYAFSLDPAVANEQGAGAELSLSSDRLQLRFMRDPDKTDIIYRVEASEDLSDWSEILYSSLSPESPYESNNDGEYMVVSDSEDIGAGTDAARFLRLVVEGASD